MALWWGTGQTRNRLLVPSLSAPTKSNFFSHLCRIHSGLSAEFCPVSYSIEEVRLVSLVGGLQHRIALVIFRNIKVESGFLFSRLCWHDRELGSMGDTSWLLPHCLPTAQPSDSCQCRITTELSPGEPAGESTGPCVKYVKLEEIEGLERWLRG